MGDGRRLSTPVDVNGRITNVFGRVLAPPFFLCLAWLGAFEIWFGRYDGAILLAVSVLGLRLWLARCRTHGSELESRGPLRTQRIHRADIECFELVDLRIGMRAVAAKCRDGRSVRLDATLRGDAAAEAICARLNGWLRAGRT